MEGKPKANTYEYKNAYRLKNYDRFEVSFPHGSKAKLKAAATAAGVSVNKYIFRAVNAAIETAMFTDDLDAAERRGTLEE